jgi:pimeloyl-ACP methyl ester carboxylesterase
MNGTKAIMLEEQCKSKGIPYCRFDYRGHGQSDPQSFLDLTLSHWIHDAETILVNVLFQEHNKVLLVGSSMGAWISIHLALRNPHKIAGIVGIATAVNFTQHSLYEKATETQREEHPRHCTFSFRIRVQNLSHYLATNSRCQREMDAHGPKQLVSPKN